MKKNLQILAILIIAIVTTSCQKDNLYIVEVNDNVDDNNDDANDNVIEKISSMIFVSDNYSTGSPAIEMNDTYTYTYSTYDTGNGSTDGTFTSTSTGISDINIKVNPSNASLDDVEWRIVRRSATTKLMDSEELFEGEVIATRADATPENVTITVANDTTNFFDADGGYVYSVVAAYSDGAEVASDVACLIDGSVITISSIFLGQEIDGSIFNYNTDRYAVTSDTTVVEKPLLYGIIENGDTLSFEQMGIDDSQYSLSCIDYPYMTTATLAIFSSLYEDESDQWASAYQWIITVHSVFTGYNYDEFNGIIGIQFSLCNGDGELIDPFCVCKFDSSIGDVELTSAQTVSSGSLTFGVFSALNEDKLMERIVGDNHNLIGDSFISTYCGYYGESSAPKFYIDGVETSNITLDSSNVFSMTLAIDEALSAGTYTIRVVLSGDGMYDSTVSETITLTVQ